MTVTTEDRTEKKKRIKELLHLTEIDRTDTQEIVKLQDLLNIDGATAYSLIGELNAQQRSRLAWIVCTVSGYETFKWYLSYGYWPHIQHELENFHNKRAEELDKKERYINSKISEYHEQHGKEIRTLREQVKRLHNSLADEKKKNSKIKALFRLLKSRI